MASTYIPGLVIKHNNDVYLTPDLLVGIIDDIPTPGAGGVPDGNFWAVPINNYGVVTGFNFEPTSASSTAAPTTQSFHVFRLTTRFGNDVWYVRGSTTTNTGASPDEAGYIQASQDAECCDGTPAVLPTDVPDLAPCQEMCEWNAAGLYFAIFQLPQLTGTTPRYYPYGSFNGVALTAATATGYATSGTLLTFLNSGAWGAIGTWTYANGSLQVTQAAGPGTDVICVNIIAINPSA